MIIYTAFRFTRRRCIFSLFLFFYHLILKLYTGRLSDIAVLIPFSIHKEKKDQDSFSYGLIRSFMTTRPTDRGYESLLRQ